MTGDIHHHRKIFYSGIQKRETCKDGKMIYNLIMNAHTHTLANKRKDSINNFQKNILLQKEKKNKFQYGDDNNTKTCVIIGAVAIWVE